MLILLPLSWPSALLVADFDEGVVIMCGTLLAVIC